MKIPSKELLSEVLEKKVLRFAFTSEYGFDAIEYEVHDSPQRGNIFQDVINIYELAHKCKEWAWLKGYYISSFKDFGFDTYFCKVLFNATAPESGKSFNSDTEPEAIFKACEWIYSERKGAEDE